MGDLLAVVDALTINATEKVLGSAQLQGSSSSKILKSQDNFHISEPRRGGLPFNDCKGCYSEFF